MLHQTTYAGETIITVPGAPFLIASKSEPGKWHQVTTSTCSCKSFAFRSRCRHIQALRNIAAEAIERYAPQPAERRARVAELNSMIWD